MNLFLFFFLFKWDRCPPAMLLLPAAVPRSPTIYTDQYTKYIYYLLSIFSKDFRRWWRQVARWTSSHNRGRNLISQADLTAFIPSRPTYFGIVVGAMRKNTSSSLLFSDSNGHLDRLLFDSKPCNGSGHPERSLTFRFIQVVVLSLRVITPISYVFIGSLLLLYLLNFPLLDGLEQRSKIAVYFLICWAVIEVDLFVHVWIYKYIWFPLSDMNLSVFCTHFHVHEGVISAILLLLVLIHGAAFQVQSPLQDTSSKV